MIMVTEAHILSTAMELFDMDSLTDTPSTTYSPEGSNELDSLQRQDILATEQQIERYVDLKIPESVQKSKKGTPNLVHGVHDYANDILDAPVYNRR